MVWRRAQISVSDPEHVALQRKLLAREGVKFDAGGFIASRSLGVEICHVARQGPAPATLGARTWKD